MKTILLTWECKPPYLSLLTPQRNMKIPWCSCKILGTVNRMLELGPKGSKSSSLEIKPFRSRVQTSISSWQYANVQWPGYRHSCPIATSETTHCAFSSYPDTAKCKKTQKIKTCRADRKIEAGKGKQVNVPGVVFAFTLLMKWVLMQFFLVWKNLSVGL